MKHPNRINKRKDKKGSGCAMCKPYKHRWEHQFKLKDREKMSDV